MFRALLSIFLLFFTVSSFAQIVNIPDANFKDALLNHNPVIDTNNDGEIQISEAESVNGNFQLRLQDKNISSLDGLEFFINLTDLVTSGNQYNSINLNQLVELKELFLNESQLEVIELNIITTLIEIRISSSSLISLDVSNHTDLELFSYRNSNNSQPVFSNLALPDTQTLIEVTISQSLISSFDFSNYINLEYLNLFASDFSNLDVSNLINLEHLSVTGNNLTQIDVSQNLNLNHLAISNQNITSVDVSNLLLLEEFYFNRCEVASIDVSNNLNLRYLAVWETNLNTLDVSNNQLLEDLRIQDNQLTNIDLSNNPQLNRLYAGGNPMNEIDLSNNNLIESLRINNSIFDTVELSNLPALDSFECKSSSLPELDFSQNTLLWRVVLTNSQFQTLDFSNSNNIQIIWVDGSFDLESINIKNTSLSDLNLIAQNNPNLNFICVDDVNEATAQNWNIPAFTTFLEDCSLIDGELNRIAGTVTYDANGNNCGTGAYGINGYLVNATDGVSNFANATIANGSYGITVSENTYTTQVLGLPPYFDTNPTTATNTFVGFDQTQLADFCAQPNTTANDLTVSIIPIIAARPGFEATYEIIYENVGTTTLTGEVTVAFSDVQVDFVESTPSPTNQTSSTLTFNVGSLTPFAQGSILATFLLEQPPVNESGDLLAYTATITPESGDATPDDNEFYFPQVIVNSFDPNDKRCVQGHQVLVEDADQYLHYIVRFQNLGTASAINVRVVDVLDELLDFSTFRVLSASDPFETTLINGQVDFIFDNINLPAEVDDPEGSNGYVTFKIKPLPGIVLGDEVNNRADIYFDFNPPVLTNLTSTSYVNVLGIDDNTAIDVVVYPNPASNIIHIATTAAIEAVTIYSTLGQQMEGIQISDDKKVLDITALAAGMYFVKVQTTAGEGVYQVIKE